MNLLPRVVCIRRRSRIPLPSFDCYIGRDVKRGGWNLEASIWATVEPPIVDPPRKGHCMLDLSIKDTARGPKKSLSL